MNDLGRRSWDPVIWRWAQLDDPKGPATAVILLWMAMGGVLSAQFQTNTAVYIYIYVCLCMYVIIYVGR